MGISKGEEFSKRDIYVNYAFEDVMYRWDHREEKIYVKFYNKKESPEPVPHDNRLFNDALLYGEEITKEEYDAQQYESRCSCNKQQMLVDITSSHSSFKANLNEVEVGNWVMLMECLECNQLWKVDEWDKYQTLYAVKIQKRNGWEEFDSKSMIKEKMILNRGGLVDTKCMWAGCTKKQVVKSAYCIDHLYETGARN